jgi:hypothetical protein
VLPHGGYVSEWARVGSAAASRPGCSATQKTVGLVKISVEVDELEPGRTRSHQVADYVRAMLKVEALRRAVGEALLDAERRKQKLNAKRLAEAQELLDEVRASHRRLRLILGGEPDSQPQD